MCVNWEARTQQHFHFYLSKMQEIKRIHIPEVNKKKNTFQLIKKLRGKKTLVLRLSLYQKPNHIYIRVTETFKQLSYVVFHS